MRYGRPTRSAQDAHSAAPREVAALAAQLRRIRLLEADSAAYREMLAAADRASAGRPLVTPPEVLDDSDEGDE